MTLHEIKEFRDKHPGLDIAAGFVPGVGEAQDAQDLYEGVKDINMKMNF